MPRIMLISVCLLSTLVPISFARSQENDEADSAVHDSDTPDSDTPDSDTPDSDTPEKSWWAFERVREVSVPVSEGDAWSQTPVDQFVFHKLKTHLLDPAPPASPEVRIRRLYFDLIGLPPTPEDIRRFAADPSSTAWERLVDQLLSDPRYGEHWGRFWLDLVRYAESDGWNQDAWRPHIWRYRDYVIRSFNQDKPFPQFVREQLAGDELATFASDPERPEYLTATGFLRLGIYEYNQRDARSHWNDIVNEMTDVTADVFLGMSVSCARCHDHKFDPILQSDYFRLKAFFEPVIWRDDLTAETAEMQSLYRERRRIWDAETSDIRMQIDQLISPYVEQKWASTVDKFPLDIQTCFRMSASDRSSFDQQMVYLISRQFEEEGGGPLKSLSRADREKYDALTKELSRFDSLRPPEPPKVMAVSDFAGEISPTVIPDISDPISLQPGFPAVMKYPAVSDPPKIARISESSGRRSALAEWIGRDDNPLTSRVIVNRIWQQHFGEGIVSTASDFGQTGQRPSHPELLDWLTMRFIENGWQMKSLHRLILTSAVWNQSSHHPDAQRHQQTDPHEKLLWRSRIRRLRAEQVRDAMLSVSGELENATGGPAVAAEQPRRAVYLKVFRNVGNELLQTFDMANGLQSTCERSVTTTPVQSLLMLNSDYTVARANALAARLQPADIQISQTAAAESVPDVSLELLAQFVWGRSVTETEAEEMREFLKTTTDGSETRVTTEKVRDLCHIMLNSSEFLYLD